MKFWIFVAAIAVVGCKKKVDTAGYEQRLTTELAAIGIKPDKVTCPKDVRAKKGESFTCQVTIAGKDYGFEATVDDVDGSELKLSTHWVDGRGIVAGKVEDALGKELSTTLGAATVVDCGEPLRFLDADMTMTCKATAATTTFDAKVTFDDDLAATAWRLTPEPVLRARLLELLTPAVQEKLGATAAVTCGDDPFFIVPADGVYWCAIDDGPKHAKLKVQFKPGTTDLEGWEAVAP